MPVRCALGCERSGVHRFPNPNKFPEKFKAWVHIMGGKLEKPEDHLAYLRKRICEVHFTEKDYNRNKRLNALAIPSQHLPAWCSLPQPIGSSSASTSCNIQPIMEIGELPQTSGLVMPEVLTTKLVVEKVNNLQSSSTSAISNVESVTFASDVPIREATRRFLAKKSDIGLEHNYYSKPKAIKSLTAAPDITVNATFQPSKPMIISEGYNSDLHSFASPASHPVSEPSVLTPSRACVENVAADTCNTGDKTTQADIRPIPKENNVGYWKQKLTHILHSTQFCGICLSTDELVNTVSDHFEIVVAGTSHNRTLADILDVVFQETEDILSNSQICSSCTQKLFQTYIFIQQARARSKMLQCHLNDLYYKTCYTRNNVVENLPQEHSDVSNVLISMENYDNIDPFQNNLYMKPAKKEVKRDCRRLKQSYKCLTCNLILPSHKAWRVHEITNHKINKMSKPQLNSVTPHQRILKRMSRICHKVVKNGELFKHLKKYHVDSLCPVCCVAYDSKDLEAHKQKWHYSDVSKCLTCLRSYSEAELQQHQCWFSCNVCTEAPCVHHKYLTCYRQQILNGALRAKCLDCQFVCRTKRAYLEHVNMCHLKFSAESSVKCSE